MRIGIIGLGSIGHEIARSFHKFIPWVEVTASVRTREKLSILLPKKECNNITIICDNQKLAEDKDQVYLCVKPLQAKEVCKEIRESLDRDTVIISVMAGVPLSCLEEWLGTKKILRVMPTINVSQNGPVVVYDPHNLKPSMPFFPQFETEEELELDKFTGWSACLPGFLSFIFEEWIEALTSSGVSKPMAERILIQNLLAYSQTVRENPSRACLIDICKRVTSEAGATEQGLRILEKAELCELFRRTMEVSNCKVEQIKKKV